jgi:hypothetical protein
MAGPNGGSKKVKSIGLPNLDNKNLIICVDETTLTAVNHMVSEIESTLNIDIDINAKVATPIQLTMSGDWMKSNVVIAWINNDGNAFMAPMDVFATDSVTIMHASVMAADGITSHIYGFGSTWTTTLPTD